jgi:hypothetical protein
MSDLLQQLDVIHAEAVKIAEHNKLMRDDNVIVQEENKRHIDNICKLRNMLKKALDNMAAQTTEDKGVYYLDGHEGHDLEIEQLLNQKQ